MPALSVIVADDHQLVRAGLSQLIGAQSDLKVIAQCRTGKEALAAEILRESVRPLGIEIEDEEDPHADEAAPAADGAKPKKAKKKKKKPVVHNPVQKVHFSNFIIQ